MKRLVLLLLLTLAACQPSIIPAPPTPPAPVPVPVPVPIPTPVPVPPEPIPIPPDDPLAPYAVVQVGDQEALLATLPGTPTKTVVASTTIWAWTTTKPRAGGGFVVWEIHVVGGLVVASFPW